METTPVFSCDPINTLYQINLYKKPNYVEKSNK